VTRDDDRADSRRRPVPHEVERLLAERGDPLMATAIAKVSVNGGHTWRPATVTAQGGGRFRIAFLAPAGSFVTLRVHATDAAGGSVTETIQRAYGIAS
jgi:hypothetical protein